MSPKKTHLCHDLDNGRSLAQQNFQLCTLNDSEWGDLRFSSSFSHDSPSQLVSEQSNRISNNFPNFKTSSSHFGESNDMQHLECCSGQYYSRSPLSRCTGSEEMINITMYNSEAYLLLKTPPEHRFRYRYDTEMSGTHGSLQGIRSGLEKSIPEVELVNFPHEALIRVSLVTCNETGERYPHPHNLFIKQKMYQKKIYENVHNKCVTKTGHYSDPHYVRVGTNGNDYVARFEGMCIISSKKENFSASIKEKLHLRDVEQGLTLTAKGDLRKKVDEAVKLVDLDFVSLCFEAFREEGSHLVPICAPLYSEPIGNAKSANTGKLKISRINKCSGSCKGGDEIWLLVEKINKKGLVIRFFEECEGRVVWESCIEGDNITLHHQYAIIFKTPPYRDPNISSEVKVMMRLERSTQLSQACNFSEPITFVYEPPKNKNHRSENLYKKESILSTNKQNHTKRPRIDTSVVPAINFQYKRKKDEEECSDEIFDEAELDSILSDNCIDSVHANQFWHGLNIEEFLQYISEDPTMPYETDGLPCAIKSRRDLMAAMHMIYTKFDENEIKKLTDRMNNMKFSKGKSKYEEGGGDEKREVEDAVCTLLSLRERAVEIKNFHKELDSNDSNNTLYQSVAKNRPDIVQGILKAADFSHQDDDLNTPLHLSLLMCRDSCTDLLLEFRRGLHSNINVKNKQGKTALHLAAANGSLHQIKLLLECGADVNETESKTQRNAVHIAAAERHRDIVEYLMENTDIRLDALDADGRSALSAAELLLLPCEKLHTEKCFNAKEMKKETERGENESKRIHTTSRGDDINLDKLYETLNETGAWRILAEMLNCSYLIATAEDTHNPSKCILNCSEQINGEIDLEALRELLDMINEKKGLIALDEILARRFL